jgi:hypothetical protein
MRAPGVPTLLLLLVAGAAIPGPVRAQQPSMEGSYMLVPEQSDRVEAAVKRATDGGGFFVRTAGRRLLTGRLRPAEQLRIAVTDSLVVLRSDDEPERAIAVVADPGDSPWNGHGEGDGPAAFAWWHGTVLAVRFMEDEGIREYRYSLDPDGRTLRVEVRVSGDRLPRPVKLSLTSVPQR